MPNYADIFDRLGAFARIHAQTTALAQRDASATESGTTLRTPRNLAASLLLAFDNQPPSLEAVAALDGLRASATAANAAAVASLRRWLVGELAPMLGAPRSATAALAALAQAMADDSEAIAGCIVGLTAPAASPANHGNGRAVANLETPTPALDAVAPSQLARTQPLVLLCTADGTEEPELRGREEWLLLAASGASEIATTIPVTTGAAEDPRNLVIDGSFTEHDTDFEHWTADGASEFSQATSGALFGDAALRIHGTGAGSLRQALSTRTSPLPAGRMLALGAWVRVSDLTSGTVTIRVEAGGTPLAAVLLIDDQTPASEWVHLSGWLLLPRTAPGALVELAVITSAGFSGDLLIDGLSLAVADGPVDGVSVALFQGPQPFLATPLADRFSLSTTSDDGGSFAVFLRDAFGVELPTSDTPTIEDTLAV